MNFNKTILTILIIVIISSIVLSFFSYYVPYHTDCFFQYSILFYRYPTDKLHSFNWPYDLAPFFGYYLPLRSHNQEGTFPSFLYYPIYKLWPSPVSARLLALIMLLIQAILIQKVFKTNLVLSFMILLFFMPYTVQHIGNLGLLCFLTTSVFLICYLTEKWMNALQNNTRHSWIYPFFIGVAIFIEIWNKLAYFAVLPGIIILLFYYFIARREMFTSRCGIRLEKLGKGIIILFFSAVIPSFILFNSKTRNISITYYDELISHAQKLQIAPQWGLLKYLFNPLQSAHRIFKVQNDIITTSGVLLAVIGVVLLVFGIRQLYIKRIKYSFVILNILLFMLTFFLIFIHPKSWGMHHVALSFPFLILALFYIYSWLNKSRFISILLIAFFVINFNLYYRLTKLKPEDQAHPSLLKINEQLNRQFADQYVFIAIDWGMYVIKALYGKNNQCVLNEQGMNRNDMNRIITLKELLKDLKRKALFIGRVDSESDLSFIKQNFPDIVELKTNYDTGKWRVWYEP